MGARSVASCALSIILLAAAAAAQGTTGTMSGTVVDESDQVLPGATVTIVDERTGATRTVVTDERGEFTFPALQPGTYTIRVELSSFRTFERRSNVLSASDHLALGRLALSLGGLTETVSVVASGAVVESRNSDGSGLLTGQQIEQISTRGRDVMSLLRLLPGVGYVDDVESLGESFGTPVPNIGGQRAHFNHITVDGVMGNEIGGANRLGAAINVDAIAEVKVILGNYRAEFGRTGGANIQIVSKSGGSDYRGSAYYYKRHDALNATNFFNNKFGLPKARYRFDTYGFNLGGPLWIPKLLKGEQKKLFFFYSVEAPQTERPGPVRQYTVPTELERRGDFSQTFDSAGRLIVVRDPLTLQPFPGNLIPPERINPNGQALLNIFPIPNAPGRAPGQYNHLVQFSTDTPKWNHILRVDYKPSSSDSITITGKHWFADQKGVEVSSGGATAHKWGLMNQRYLFLDSTLSAGHTRIFNRGLLNEGVFGVRRASEDGPPVTDADWERIRRSTVGWTLPQFRPDVNPHAIIPKTIFAGSGGVTNGANVQYDNRFVLDGLNWVFSFRDNLTYSRGQHLFKAGVYVEEIRNREGPGGTFAGEFDFRRDSNNPLDTGYVYSNALLGVFKSYQESEARPGADASAWLAEWYVQDTWRATRKLTVDYGVRFVWVDPWQQRDRQAAVFVPERWDQARAPLLYMPTLVDGRRVGIDPRTGQTVPVVLIGTFIPGTGDPANGMVTADDPNYPDGFRDRLLPQPAPRVGFAYDIFGNSKTALRGGFGIFHQSRHTVTGLSSLTGNPPIQRTPIFFNGTFDSLFQPGTSLALRPVDTNGVERHSKIPSTYSARIGVQQDVGWGTVIDLSYVVTVGRHLEQRQDLNTLPDGTKYLDLHPENRDPSTGRVLADNFLRPYRGYENIYLYSNFGTSNYNALQFQMNRRYTKGLQYSVAYTW